MKTILKTLGVLIILAIIGIALYFGYSVSKKQNTIPPNTFPNQNASSTPDMTASSTPAWTFATSTLDTSKWKSYTNPELGLTIKYPSNLITTGDNSSESFVFSKVTYFHWPLQDDVKITVSASSTCPGFIGGAENTSATTTFMLNGREFTHSENHGAAAGNLYTEIAYDTMVNGVCYRVDFFDHGANGAGLYVSDPSLISQYDAQHDTDMKAVLDIFNAMTQTLKISH